MNETQDKFLLTATIANAASLSGVVDLGNRSPVALIMPAAWTAASITVQVSVDGTTYVNAYSDGGVEHTLTVGTSQYVILDPVDLCGARYIKLRSGTSGAAQNQGAARTIGVVVRHV